MRIGLPIENATRYSRHLDPVVREMLGELRIVHLTGPRRSDEVDLLASLRAVMQDCVEVEECTGPLPFQGAEKRDSQLQLREDAPQPS